MPEAFTIETERLVILPPSESHYEIITKLYEDTKSNGYATGLFDELSKERVETAKGVSDKIKMGFELVAKEKDGDSFIGYLRAGFVDGNRGAWIYTLIIVTEHRKKGYGTELVNAVESYFKGWRDVSFVGLSVIEENYEGNSFWKSLGYNIKETLIKPVFSQDGLSKINIYVKLF